MPAQRTQKAADGKPMEAFGLDQDGKPIILELPEILVPPTWPPPLSWWHNIVVGFSNGKEARALLRWAISTFGRERITAEYCILGNEHPGSINDAKAFCKRLQVPLLFTWKNLDMTSDYGPEPPAWALDRDLMIDLVLRNYENRSSKTKGRNWPSDSVPFCQSRGKAAPTDKLLNRYFWPADHTPFCQSSGKRDPSNVLLNNHVRGRTLFLTGERGAESDDRAKQALWAVRSYAYTKGKVILWHRPLLHWSDDELFSYLARHRIDLPASYTLGWSRHGCMHCPTKSHVEMVLSFYYDWRRGAARVALEELVGPPHKRYRFNGHVGFRAVWEQVYGAWTGEPAQRPSVRPEAEHLVRSYRRSLSQIMPVALKDGEARAG